MSSDRQYSTGAHLSGRQEQRQSLSQKQLQTLGILHLSRLELEQYLENAMALNPFIETEELPSEESLQDFQDPGETVPGTEDETDYEAMNAENSDEWYDELPIPSESGESPDFLLFKSAPGPTLEENLIQELELSTLPEGVKKELCKHIIEQLDEEGFLRLPLQDIAMNCNADLNETERALKFIQSFDPPGIGARSIQECWMLQLRRRGELTPAFEQLLTSLTDELSRNRMDLAAAKLHISMSELEDMLKKLKHLNRTPVATENVSVPIIPDLEIMQREDGSFFAQTAREKRKFKLSEYAEWEKSPDAGKDFVEKIREAKNILESLEFRKSTILRIGEMLIDVQQDFLIYGPEKLEPFTMKQAADYLEFKSESTISRAVADKYVKTPHGVFPLKYFFSAGYVGEDGEKVSRRADMEKLKELIAAEDKHHPLSDEKLSQMLNESGHIVSRRTVVKYREIMKIPNSSLRKEFF